MKKRIVGGILSGLLLAATAAQAEHKLLITDVLDAKQVEAQVGFEFTHGEQKWHQSGNFGRVYSNISESRFSLGVGVGMGLELSASLPYAFSEQKKNENTARHSMRGREGGEVFGEEAKRENRDGIGDFAVGAKYALLTEKKSPVSLTVGLDAKFDTAKDDAGTGTTNISPYLAVSKNFGHLFVPYASYRATIRNHDAADSHIISVGVESELHDRITLDARLDSSINVNAKRFSPSETYTVDLAAYLRLYKNIYVIPSVAAGFGSLSKDDMRHIQYDSPNSIKGAVALYALF
jgi:hypothetical protein